MTDPAVPAVGQLLAPSLDSPKLALAVQSRAEGVPALARLSAVAQRLLVRHIIRELDGLLSVDITALAERMWTAHTQLVAAGYRTAANQRREILQLGPHTVTSTHRPTVDVIINDQHAMTVEFLLTIKLQVHALVASVQAGYLTAIQPGPCICTASLACEGVPLPSATSRLDLPGRVDLGQGHPLVPNAFLSTRATPSPA